jgi:hypothetical protein
MQGNLEDVDGEARVVLHLSQQELLFLAGAVNETIEAVDDWEFSTRLGVDKSAARATRSEMGQMIAALLH